MTLGWGIIGTGGIANNTMAPAINASKDGRLVAAVSRDLDRAKAFAERHGAQYAYTNYQDLLDNKDVDIIYIATPNAQHPEQTIAAARAGKHVLCDKPLAATVAEAQQMVDACKQAGVKFGTNFQTRHHQSLRAAKQLIEEGAIGDVILVQAEASPGAAPLRSWRTDIDLAGLGCTNNIGVHIYDVLRFLLSSEVVEVLAMSDAGQRRELETLMLALFRFDSGAMAYVNANQKTPHPQNDVDIYGTKGRISGVRCSRPFQEGELHVITEKGETVTPYSSKDAYLRIVAAFNEAVLNNQEPNPSGLDGLRSVQVTSAMARSTREGVLVKLSD